MPEDEFRRYARETADWMSDYLATVGDLPVFSSPSPGFLTSALPREAPDHGESMDEVLRDFRELVVPGLTHWNHPSFFGYFSITASGPGILGEMLAAALNVNAMVWRSSPAATELEDVTTNWLRQLVGLPEVFEGVINDTASSSSLYALAAAREVAYPEAHSAGMFGMPRGRIYASEEAHSSIEKAVLTLGFGREGFRTIPTDEAFSMDVEALRAAIAEDVVAGIQPVGIVATLGTTSAAAVDPVDQIADLAEEYGVWLHVDAAYGGSAAVVPEVRALFQGWDRADSVVINPHKWLFTPIDCSVLYCQRPEMLVRAFSIVPEYLTSAEQAETRSLMDYGVSLGRRFRALKLWFVLRAFGRDGIRARIRYHVEIARHFAELVEAEEEWEVTAPVHLSLVTIRHVAGDKVTKRAMDRVNGSGEAFLTHTDLRGQTVIRLAIGNLKTTRDDVLHVWDLLREAAALEVSED
jgi:aromatic-L-amino-acid decarboxylase